MKLSQVFKNLFIKVASEKNGCQEETRKFQHFSLFLVAGVPLMIAFGIINFFSGNYNVTFFALFSAVGLICGWLISKNIKDSVIVYRVNIVFYMILLLCVLVVGGDAGSKSLWLYTYPIIVFFLFGVKEGMLWNLCIILPMAALFFSPFFPIYDYSSAYKLRFFLSYGIVSLLAYSLEYLRGYYKKELERRNADLIKEVAERKKAEQEKEEVIVELKNALYDVQELSGLLPICSSCKKIRDDKGYWSKIEEYIQTHTDTTFTHGICPDCVTKLYPDIDLEKYLNKIQ